MDKNSDKINPAHYTSHPSGVECIQITEHMDFCLGNAMKYLWRAGQKQGEDLASDLLKAKWYIERKLQLESPMRPSIQEEVTRRGVALKQKIEREILQPDPAPKNSLDETDALADLFSPGIYWILQKHKLNPEPVRICGNKVSFLGEELAVPISSLLQAGATFLGPIDPPPEEDFI